jgi:putative hemolysin
VMVVVIGAFILLAAVIVFFVVYRKSDRSEIKKRAISNRKQSNTKGSLKQTCSYCKKKASPLTFYADRNGKVIGVCKVCKVQAERQALMKI